MAAQNMNAIEAMVYYIDKMFVDVPGMKVLLLDQETLGMLSVVYSRAKMMEKQVVFHQLLSSNIPREKMTYLNCVAYLRPTRKNVDELAKELKNPKYAKYYIVFSNKLDESLIDRLAEADVHEKVVQVHEYYADFYAAGRYLFHADMKRSMLMNCSNPHDEKFNRAQDAVISALLALERQPNIRFSRNSLDARAFANGIFRRISNENLTNEGLFGGIKMRGRSKDGQHPLLLVLDRRDDPITPLLNQWTYQAMVHELIDPTGIWRNRVDLKMSTLTAADGPQECTLSEVDDDFYAAHMYDNFGDVSMASQEAVTKLTASQGRANQGSSFADLQKIMADMPDIQGMQKQVTKHLSLLDLINKKTQQLNIFEVSKCEQDVACNSDFAGHFEQVKALLPKCKDHLQKIKLVMLFAIRYQPKQNKGADKFRSRVGELKNMCASTGVSRDNLKLIDTLLDYAGNARRTGDLLMQRSTKKRWKKSLMKNIMGVENVFTQHEPYLAEVLKAVMSNTLREEYPWVKGRGRESEDKAPPKDIIVFMIGGVTYEEAKCVAELNAKNKDTEIVLGSTSILRSLSFLSGLKDMLKRNEGSYNEDGEEKV